MVLTGLMMPESQLLYTPGPNQNLKTVLDKIEKDSFITLPGKGGHSRLLLKKKKNNFVSPFGDNSEEFYSNGSMAV